eukprot:scaffold243213_cov32-Tisochrysis_lutea.AAC.2
MVEQPLITKGPAAALRNCAIERTKVDNPAWLRRTSSLTIEGKSLTAAHANERLPATIMELLSPSAGPRGVLRSAVATGWRRMPPMGPHAKSRSTVRSEKA